MGPFRTARSARERAAALLIVLAMVVLMTGLAVAYLSRTTSDRQVAQSSFHQSKVDELASSAMDLIIGDLQTEIVNGSSPAPTVTPSVSPLPIPTATPLVYTLAAAANIVPMRWPSATPGTTPAISNLVRRSMFSDQIPSPAMSSHASNVNSTQASANGRLVKLPRWNKHYLVPRATASPTPLPTDTTPIGAFGAPDWVILTRNGPVAFSTWNATLADATQSNNSYCVGRYAYAIYDEAGLLDANVAGYPTNATAAQFGPKGVSAFADLSVLGLTASDINAIVGWRNYFSAVQSGTFPNFNINAANYLALVLSNTNGFMTVPVPSSTPNKMGNTDQQFTTRQSLINLLINSGLSDADVVAGSNGLQYLGTFSRELNAPTWAPTRNATDMGAPNNGTGNIYAYKDNGANPAATPVNPNLLNVRVQNSFTRADGNTAAVGEPLINRRFPLTRLAGLSPIGIVTTTNSTIVNGVPSVATAATIQRDFGLVWDGANNRWLYAGSSGSTALTAIKRLDLVAAENREPNFFELLKAAILSGSVGLGSGSAIPQPVPTPTPTFVASEKKYYDTTNGFSSDYQIMQIGANIISQWDSSNIPIFIGFGLDTATTPQPYEVIGIKNLPYLNKLVFEPSWTTVHGGGPYQFDAWLLPSLWNPHQNAASATGSVQIAMTSGALSAITTSPNITTASIVASPTPISMTVNANAFATPSAPTSAGSIIGSISKSPDGYYGFHVSPTPSPTASPDNNLATAFPYFGSTGCTFALQVQVNGTWKTYERWQTYPSPSPSPTLYLYADNSDNAVYYTDLDGVKRRGDSVTLGNTSVMQPANSSDRPLVLAGAFQNGVFQSVGELGHVFRDQPWKTLSFTSAMPTNSTTSVWSADAGLLDVFTLHASAIEAGKTFLTT